MSWIRLHLLLPRFELRVCLRALPVIHYKVFAAGRNNPKDAFVYVAKYLRPMDAVCIGVFTKDNPNMIEEDMALFEQATGADKAK